MSGHLISSRPTTTAKDEMVMSPYRVGDHVICPWPWCGCGYALGVVPGQVVGLEGDDIVVELDTTGCSTGSASCHVGRPLVFTTAEIDELAWIL